MICGDNDDNDWDYIMIGDDMSRSKKPWGYPNLNAWFMSWKSPSFEMIMTGGTLISGNHSPRLQGQDSKSDENGNPACCKSPFTGGQCGAWLSASKFPTVKWQK